MISSPDQVPWQFAVRSWYSERSQFRHGQQDNNLTAVGHYTQLVWAASSRLGCGFAHCRRHAGTNTTSGWRSGWYSYVCREHPATTTAYSSDAVMSSCYNK